jgi:hypothetical protein
MIGRTIANLVDTAFNRMAPPNIQRRFIGADFLTNLEQHIDVWESDELWAAEQRRRLVESADTYAELLPWEIELLNATKQPADADVPGQSPRPVAGVGGSTTQHAVDESVELSIVIANVLRDLELTDWPTSTAGIVAREVLHHYMITKKA